VASWAMRRIPDGRDSMSDLLFSPITIGGLQLPNRIAFMAHRTNFSTEGRLNARHRAYYRRRAQGGCGLLVLGELGIHPADMPWESLIRAYDPQIIKDYARLAEAVHEEGAKIFARLNHHGFQSSGALSRREVWGPSAVADVAFGEVAKAMEEEDVKAVVEAFVQAAVFAKRGGLDGVEIDVGPESLLRQFLSPISNQRQDAYGGSLENRMRVPLDVITAVREAVGRDFVLGVRLCVDEQFWGGITAEEGVETAKTLEGTGAVDFISATLGTYYNLYLHMASMHTPEGFARELAEMVKRNVDVPVISCHQISTPETAAAILEQGEADLVGLVRPLICDPDFPRKAKEGRRLEIRFCARDNEGCVGRVNRGRTLGCTQNPAVGREAWAVTPALSKASRKRVIVVGAGPAGLAAARTARGAGHEVEVYEKQQRVGGQVLLAQRGAGRRMLWRIVEHLEGALRRLGVSVYTGVEVTPGWVLEQDLDAVIVTTGSIADSTPVHGSYGPPDVVSIREALWDAGAVGERVLLLDENGGHHATATAEFLADHGKRVELVTSEPFVGMALGPLGDLYLTRQRLLQKGVSFRTDFVVDRIEGRKVKGHDAFTYEEEVLEGYDTIVLAMGDLADESLYNELKGKIASLYRAGDCVAPRGIRMAILEGDRVGGKL